MTFLVYIEYQNFTSIHIEEIIPQVVILFEVIVYKYVSHFDCCHIWTKSMHVVVSIKCGC